MITAYEPCMFHYFVFLVKEQGDFSSESIEEIKALWKRLGERFGLTIETDDLEDRIREMSEKIYMDKTVKILDTIHTPDKKVWLRQDLAHDALIVTFLINSPDGTKTDAPLTYWKDFYSEVSVFSNEVKKLFFHSTVLQTILDPETAADGEDHSEHLAKTLSKEYNPFSAKTVKSVKLPSGRLWKFADNHKFLFTLTRDQEQEASLFLANEFPYIVSLMGKVENHYLYAVELYESLNHMEKVSRELEMQLPEILECEETKILEVKRDQIAQMGKSAIETLSSLRICGNNISANLKNLQSALPDTILEDDSVFASIFEKFDEFQENITSWSEVSENILMRITKYIDDTKAKLTEYITQEKMKESLKIVPEAGSQYTGTEDVEFKMDNVIYSGEGDVKDTAAPRPIEWGSNYMLYEDDPKNCLDFIKIMGDKNFQSFCITRQHPDKLAKKYSLDDLPLEIRWLSTTSCDFCIPPTLTRISHEINKFLKSAKNRIVMLDGLEFLVNHNDFMQVLKFLDSTKENVIINESIMLVSISPHAFSPKELSLLKKNTGVIGSVPAGYDVSKLL